jgi:hypothetical protein
VFTTRRQDSGASEGEDVTYGRTSIRLASLSGWSGRITTHSNFSGAGVVEAIVRKIEGFALEIEGNFLIEGLRSMRGEREKRDMSDGVG